jgi:hypothetical protein
LRHHIVVSTNPLPGPLKHAREDCHKSICESQPHEWRRSVRSGRQQPSRSLPSAQNRKAKPLEPVHRLLCKTEGPRTLAWPL